MNSPGDSLVPSMMVILVYAVWIFIGVAGAGLLVSVGLRWYDTKHGAGQTGNWKGVIAAFVVFIVATAGTGLISTYLI